MGAFSHDYVHTIVSLTTIAILVVGGYFIPNDYCELRSTDYFFFLFLTRGYTRLKGGMTGCWRDKGDRSCKNILICICTFRIYIQYISVIYIYIDIIIYMYI